MSGGGGHEAGAGEVVGADLAPGVEVVPLVPAVVGHLVAPMGLDQGVEHGADPDGVVGHPALGGGRSACHDARAPFVGGRRSGPGRLADRRDQVGLAGMEAARAASDRLSTFIIEVSGRLSTTTTRSGAL